jgi:aminoglycoside phosphotransferase (APT) family kinase protein
LSPPEPTPTDLATRFARFAEHALPGARGVRVVDLERIHGGASRETYRLELRWEERGDSFTRRLILRRDPAGSLIETDRHREFAAYKAFHGTTVPVPEPLWLEEDPHWLERPFFVMEELRDLESSPQTIVAPPYADHAERLGRQKWSILGEIARTDPAGVGLQELLEDGTSADRFWERELDHWERVLDADELTPQPIIRAAIRWLRRTPPNPPARPSVVHGDYRTGNFLYDQDGNVRAILDWEMVHLGDPLEDLAWSLNDIWRFARDERAGGLLPREEAIRVWETASGQRVDRTALRWWEIFSSVKGQGIWVSSAKEYLEGTNRDPILFLSGWLTMNSQDRAALAAMGHLS